MGLFNKLKEPVFLKESSDAECQLVKLKELEPLLTDEGKARIQQDIKCIEAGFFGEKSIAFELENSHIPMYILHDIYFEFGDLSAQIDYFVFTRKLCFIIECKNLFGDIEINNVGDFVRTMTYNGKKIKEGLYSPITQNQRHLELMKKIKTDGRSSIISKFIAGKFFEDSYKSIVVLANPKTVLNAKFAKKEVKEKVIRADQLITYIKTMYNESRELELSDEKLQQWANSYLMLHKANNKDYLEKYNQYKLNDFQLVHSDGLDNGKCRETRDYVDDSRFYKKLKEYRLLKSREEMFKPYCIYSDIQLRDIIHRMPKSKNELLELSGFGDAKIKKYGEDIIRIINSKN